MVRTPNRDDRGQLLLVGAIGVALVIVGTVVLLNGLAFDDSISARSSDDALSGAERTVEMIETDINRLAREVRADTETGGGDFAEAFRENLSLYSRHYTNLSFDNGIVYTNVTFDGSESVGGTLLRQRLDTNGDARSLRDGNGAGQNELEVARNATSFTQFNLTIHEFACPLTQYSAIRFEENGSSDYWEIRLTRDDCGSGDTRYVNISDSSGQIESVNSDDALSETGTVEINISDGDLHIGDSIEFAFAPGLNPPYDISISSTNLGQPGTGTYRIRTDSSYPTPSPGQDHPEIRSIVYSPAVDIYYQRRDVIYNRTVVLNETGAR